MDKTWQWFKDGKPWIVESMGNGEFWLTGLTPGEYTVSELPAELQDLNDDKVADSLQGLMSSFGDDYTVIVLSGQEYVYGAGASLPDALVTGVEPDDFEEDTAIVDPLVKFSTTSAQTVVAVDPNYNAPDDDFDASTGSLVFGVSGASSPASFSLNRRLRVDFRNPVGMVAIDAIGNNGVDFARLEAFSSSGKSLGKYDTSQLMLNDVETMWITRVPGSR